ncbi:hypothetical protein [Glycomyces tarimensis]
MNRRLTATNVSMVLLLALASSSCTADDPDVEPIPSPEPESESLYYEMPTDPCAVIDLTALEALVGAVESTGPDYADEDETFTLSGRTHCNVTFNDGTDETLMTISLEMFREPVGTASEQDPDNDFGFFWAYPTDSGEDNLDSVPDPVDIPVRSAWESAQMQHFTQISDDRLSWDPEGDAIALVGRFTESNVVALVALTRQGFGTDLAPDAEPYVEPMTALADQLHSSLVVR